jgi:hypothetical protein
MKKKIINSIHQHSTSPELHTALCTMTVNMEAPRGGQAGF